MIAVLLGFWNHRTNHMLLKFLTGATITPFTSKLEVSSASASSFFESSIKFTGD